uniref:Uncharacterized protein n=1 Tax=Cacopsylla melanoneura TaxID=428564 RepID=A0A8D9E4E0_9HEMI
MRITPPRRLFSVQSGQRYTMRTTPPPRLFSGQSAQRCIMRITPPPILFIQHRLHRGRYIMRTTPPPKLLSQHRATSCELDSSLNVSQFCLHPHRMAIAFKYFMYCLPTYGANI